MRSVLILGSGYTGKRVAELGKARQRAGLIVETHRSSSENRFVLDAQETWKNLPQVVGTFWMFPAVPSTLVSEFISESKHKLGKIVIVGSTSAFDVPDGDEVTERSPLQLSELRVQGEEKIRKAGGVVVRAAGIYGPGRDPRDWIRAGRVRDPQKLVNFIQVEDLAEILWAAMLSGQPGGHYLAADGRPFLWGDLMDVWKFPRPMAIEAPQSSKRVNPSATLKELQIQLKYPSVLDGVR